MMARALLVLVLELVLVVLTSAGAPQEETHHIEQEFDAFVLKFERTYVSAEERARRFLIFAENFAFITAENAKGHSHVLGVTQFADLTFTEWREQMLNTCHTTPAFKGLRKLGVHQVPLGFQANSSSVDWVAKGAVTPVKNQGQCGSCWAFSTTGSLEGATFIAKGELTSMSEQNLMDCDHVDQKCNGGLMDHAFKWLETNPICTEKSYPYVCSSATSSQCENSNCKSNTQKCTTALAAHMVTGYTDVTGTANALESAVVKQPVSVAIEADTRVFQLYTSGVIKGSACGTSVDHGVLVVGFGTDPANGDYWKIKNSWGGSWGEQGYVRIERGFSATGGECGVRTNPSYPSVNLKAAGPSTIVV